MGQYLWKNKLKCPIEIPDSRSMGHTTVPYAQISA